MSDLLVSDINFDPQNPRIRYALNKYKGKPNAKQISFALSTGSEGESATMTFERLRSSIRSNRGITQAIIVEKKGEKYNCIDGNTRLAIYKDFQKDYPDEDLWNSIYTRVLDNPTQKNIDSIRISAHLIGAREWPAYEKAQYLHDLYHGEAGEFQDKDELAKFCGTSGAEISKQIQAFEDMNEFYRDTVEESHFKMDRFSGFVEMQRKEVKDSIIEAGYDLMDFGNWIKKGQIFRLADVRKLPRVLKDEVAKNIFVNGKVNSIGEALKELDRRGDNFENATLKNATLEQLALATKLKIDSLSLIQIQQILSQADTDNTEHSTLVDLSESLTYLLESGRD
jgi:hypothetical protein